MTHGWMGRRILLKSETGLRPISLKYKEEKEKKKKTINRLEKLREKWAKKIPQETEDERETRLQKHTEIMARKLSQEMEDQRETNI
jgi:hypothetical protein